MLDHIDLERSARTASTQQGRIRRGTIFTVGVLVAIVVFLVVVPYVLPGMAFQKPNFYALLALRGDSTWHAVNDVPLDPAQVRVSPSGVVWITDHEKLSRFDGTAWQ